MRLTTGNPAVSAPEVVANDESEESDLISARYFLTVSAEAEEVILNAGPSDVSAVKISDNEYQGSFQIDADTGLIDVSIRWQDDTAGHYFAKLVIEAEGRKTFTHVFDSRGAIEDFVELPF
ncbi:hypothetical protein [Luteolibacter sp. AS25]|uniref:hypothetical protein n=1 Tax=Luteolibacter sp. AS25 TaxID=3135776 RepID=UPI00398B4EDD